MPKVVCYTYDCNARQVLEDKGLDLDTLNVPKAEFIENLLGKPEEVIELVEIQRQLNWLECLDTHYYIFVED